MKPQRAGAPPEAAVLAAGVVGLILTIALGPGGFVLGSILVVVVAFVLVKRHKAKAAEPTPVAAAAGPRTLPAEHSVTVTGEERYQDVLALLAPTPPRNVVAELRECVIARGAHQGETTLEVLVNGRPVGRLTHAMGRRYGHAVEEWRARTGQALCEAVVTHEGTRGFQITVRLPR
ncbi:hypothetical protein ACRAKI_29605 [Saccharothrix isguenensis]